MGKKSVYVAENAMKPIRDKSKIEAIRNYLLLKKRYRDEFLFTLALNTGRRMGDLVDLKVRDIKHKDHLVYIEKKTGKKTRILLDNIKDDIREYCKGKSPNEYLFLSRQFKYNKPSNICYNTAYKMFKKLFKKFKIEQSATHTLRKTFGYWHYQENKDLESLRILFNHSCIEITRIYICIGDDEVDRTIKKMKKL